MKVIKILLFLLLCLLPFDVHALTGSTEIKCDKITVVPGDLVTCSLFGVVNVGEVSAVSSKIKTTSNLILNDIETTSSWEGNGKNGIIELYTDENKMNSFNIVTFTLKVSKNIINVGTEKITIGDTKFYDDNYEEVMINSNLQEIKVLSTINTLSNITLSTGMLSPVFDSDILNYSLTLDAETIIVNAVKTDDNSTITGDVGELKLKYGINIFKINVTSESNAIKTYTITINRVDNRSTDNKLSSLIINDNNINLVDGQLEYQYEVDYNIEKVNIDAILNSDKAIFVENFGPNTVNLKEGENRIELKVKSENGEVAVYTLIIKRKSKEIDDYNSDKDVNNNDNKIDKDKIVTDEITNPKTGSTTMYIVVGIAVISSGLSFYFYKQYQKKSKQV